MKSVRLAAVALALLLPTGAAAVNVSSNQGSGIQYKVTSYDKGGKVDGNLKSTYGNPVYYQGRLNWHTWACGVSEPVNYTGHVTSKSGVAAGGTIVLPAVCNGTNVQSRVAQHKAFAPDYFGSWSAEY